MHSRRNQPPPRLLPNLQFINADEDYRNAVQESIIEDIHVVNVVQNYKRLRLQEFSTILDLYFPGPDDPAERSKPSEIRYHTLVPQVWKNMIDPNILGKIIFDGDDFLTICSEGASTDDEDEETESIITDDGEQETGSGLAYGYADIRDKLPEAERPPTKIHFCRDSCGRPLFSSLPRLTHVRCDALPKNYLSSKVELKVDISSHELMRVPHTPRRVEFAMTMIMMLISRYIE